MQSCRIHRRVEASNCLSGVKRNDLLVRAKGSALADPYPGVLNRDGCQRRRTLWASRGGRHARGASHWDATALTQKKDVVGRQSTDYAYAGRPGGGEGGEGDPAARTTPRTDTWFPHGLIGA